jgi:hypothetical protein
MASPSPSRLRALSVASAAALLTACSSTPTSVLVHQPTETQTTVMGGIYGDATPPARTISTKAFVAAPSLGLCVGEEATRDVPQSSQAQAATQMLQLGTQPRLRTNFMLACGVSNAVVQAHFNRNGQTVASFLAEHGRPANPAPANSFRNVTTVSTGDFFDPTRQVQCAGTLVVAELRPGAKVNGLPAGSVLKEWGNFTVPAGSIVPTQEVLWNGEKLSSTLGCFSARAETERSIVMPAPRGNQTRQP